MTDLIQELINSNNRMTRPTEKRHPGIAELSINETKLDQNPRRLSLRVLDDKKGRWGNEVYPKPGIRPGTQILPKPISSQTNPSTPATDNNLFSEVIQHLKGIKDPLIKTLQVREDKHIPRVKRTKGATKTMTTDSIPRPQQSLLLMPLSKSATDLRRLRKSSTGAREESNEVLGRLKIHLITVADPIVCWMPCHQQLYSSKKGGTAGRSGTTGPTLCPQKRPASAFLLQMVQQSSTQHLETESPRARTSSGGTAASPSL